VTLNAGQIQIGLSSGITTTYLGGSNPPTASGCTGGAISYNPGFTSCLSVTGSQQGSPTATGITGSTTGTGITGVNTGSTTGWLTKAEFNGVFESAASGSLNPGISPRTATNGVTFSFDNQSSPTTLGIADFGNNPNPTAGLYTLTVPVGIYDVSSVSTMLQDFWASTTATDLAGAPLGAGGNGQSTAVTFEFSTASDGSGTDYFETVYLTNGKDIRAGITCGDGTVNCASEGVGTYATGYLATDTLTDYQSGTYAGMLSGTTNGTVSETFTPNVYSASFTGGGLANAYSSVQTGSVQLDEQTFNFGSTYVSDYLVAVIIDNQMYPGTSIGSKASLSAITVNQVTPEPSTIFLLMAGLGSIGLGRLRLRKLRFGK
jgi:hypothetical protein